MILVYTNNPEKLMSMNFNITYEEEIINENVDFLDKIYNELLEEIVGVSEK